MAVHDSAAVVVSPGAGGPDELRDHLERKTEEYIAQGMTQDEANRRARLDVGGIEQTKEKCRDTRGVNWIQDFVQDLRYGLRMLRKSPGFTAVAALTWLCELLLSQLTFSNRASPLSAASKTDFARILTRCSTPRFVQQLDDAVAHF